MEHVRSDLTKRKPGLVIWCTENLSQVSGIGRTTRARSRGAGGVVTLPRFRRDVLAVDCDRRVRREAERRLKADPEPGSDWFFQISSAACRGKNDGRSRNAGPEVRDLPILMPIACHGIGRVDDVPRGPPPDLCVVPPPPPRRAYRSAILTWFPAHRRSAFTAFATPRPPLSLTSGFLRRDAIRTAANSMRTRLSSRPATSPRTASRWSPRCAMRSRW